MRRLLIAVLSCLCLPLNPAFALEWEEGAVLVRVVDVGAGLCCVAKIAGEDNDHHYIVFDAGNYEDGGKTAMKAIREIVPDDDTIDLLVLSHTDSDHNAAVPEIVNEYYVDRVLRTGSKHFGSFPDTLKNAREAIARAVEQDGSA